MSVKTPDWVKHAIFYQIFPDRFARSARTQHPRGIHFKPWGSPPEEQGYQGGDLYGIVDKLDYLQELGITALYLNPIFSSAANHRYHTFDYFQIDPLLGGEKALRELLDQAHARNMRVVLDGVFNHASRGFWAFHHILENGVTSPYIDWFNIHGWPLRPYIHDEHNPHNYDAWWGIPALPKFNFNNQGVRDYFLKVSQHWIEFGIDGWRLDVPEEINDAAFWQDFRRVVKTANPDAYIVGEIWHEAHEWLRGDRFDAVMNYAMNRAAFGFFAQKTLRTDYRPGGFELRPVNAHDFAAWIEHLVRLHDWEIVQAQLNLLDSHDTARTLWIVNNDERAARLCLLFQMTIPGAPCIYYGDEVGMTGANDPYCRGAFPWHEPAEWNQDLLHFYRQVTALRHQYAALRIGDFKTLHAENDVYAFRRNCEWQSVIVAFNADTQPIKATIPSGGFYEDGRTLRTVWPAQAQPASYTVSDGKLKQVTIGARSAVVLVAE
ncbi:MAG: glycoside hydrolase family 13 protein [Caldilineaceae bacterium]|nr:glycoside hydrolase family 13 protein [Caldilineaceae bacterium]